MKRILIFVNILVGVLTLSACSSEQISSAIEDCQNDPDCIDVVDNAITEELSARGITGGIMTKTEIEAVEDVLYSYYIDLEQYSSELYSVITLYLTAASISNPENTDEIQDMERNINQLFNRDEFINDLFLLKNINVNKEQYFTLSDNRYLLYKTGVTSYRYEVQADQIYEFDIDIELNKIYLSNQLISINQDIFTQLLSNEISFNDTYFIIANDVIYYGFNYDGYMVGAFNLETNERSEIAIYDFGYDIITYSNNAYNYTRYTTSNFSGSISEFLNFIIETNTSLNDAQAVVINNLLVHFSEDIVEYQVNISN